MELHQRLLLSAALTAGAMAWAAPAVTAAPLGQLAQLAREGGRVTALVWDLETDRAIAELQPDQRLTPASLSKLIIAAAALDTWPPDKSFATQLLSAAPPRDGVIDGALVLRGSGDATLDETTLWALAAQLRSAGVTRIAGSVLVERTPFGELGCDTIDRCRSLRRSARAYNAAPSAIGVNYGSWCIAVRAPPGANSALVGGCATGDLPIALDGRVEVRNNGAPLRVERNTESLEDRISVSGSIAPGTERQIHRAMSDPAAGAGAILRTILLQIGIRVDGPVETTITASTAAHPLARVEGLPLQEQLGRMLRYSNNYIADVLTMGVALQQRRSAPRSLGDASQVLGTLVRSANATPAPAGDLPVLESGSGLTPANRLSARDLVQVLRRQYHDARHFPVFYGALVVPRDAPFAYLKAGNADWLDRVALKTGSLTEPVSVNGIAGYLRNRRGGFAAFAIIVNGGSLRQIGHDRSLRAARSDLESLLAAY
jgi:D-alanyl-D-alanine carboxypeptidase/D-alanyl-D-alanine-endopeptidase (penicillin-binding protein 4)